MRKLYVFCFFTIVWCGRSLAQFSGVYAPSNWTTFTTTGSGIVNTAFVNTSSAPGSIIITGSDDPSDPFTTTPVNIDYTITAASSGVWSFNWSYTTNDRDKDPKWDLAGVLINGVFTQLSANTLNAVNQSGSFSQNVSAGSVIGFRVSAVDNSFGNATFTISAFAQPTGTLPVLLTDFMARAQDKKVLLQWHAATEINTSYYAVERSEGLGFQPIGKVAAGQVTGNYSFTDIAPQAGTQYYRLRMVDRDGSFSYSATRAVKAAAGAMLQLYPNPATDRVQVTIQAAGAGSETLELYSAAGVLLQQKTIVLAQGTNSTSMDVPSLPKGVYPIRAKKAGWVQVLLKD